MMRAGRKEKHRKYFHPALYMPSMKVIKGRKRGKTEKDIA